jgi:uroporphyrin-III C-methyltransferase
MKSPKLTLVGAGPGDPGLITMKGIEALRDSDVVLYDALANPSLLEHVPEHARKIFVGKRKDSHSYSQEEINTMIASYAFKYGHVVRLKGGDPFVLGRGMEEIEAAQAVGIETHYVPGVSSAIAVPGLAGIPLTHRNVSKSVWIISGTDNEGSVTNDLRLAARSEATVVVLMGMSTLREIVRIYREEGRSETRIAIIQNGSLDIQQSVAGTISTIEVQAKQSHIGAPAIIVIGDVVRFFHQQKDETIERDEDQLQ